MTLAENLTALPDQMLDALSTAQEAYLSAVTSLVATAKPLIEKLPTRFADQLSFTSQLPDTTTVVENAFGFAEKLIANQKEFAAKPLDLYRTEAETSKPAAQAA